MATRGERPYGAVTIANLNCPRRFWRGEEHYVTCTDSADGSLAENVRVSLVSGGA